MTKSKRKKIGRTDLTKSIYKQLNGAIPYRSIYYAVNVIVQEMAKEIILDRVISVKRFGTLSPYSIPGHLANDIMSGEVREIPTVRSVKFHPHESFLSLIKDRKDGFRKKVLVKKPTNRESERKFLTKKK